MAKAKRIRGVWYHLDVLTEKKLKSLNLTEKELKELGLFNPNLERKTQVNNKHNGKKEGE